MKRDKDGFLLRGEEVTRLEAFVDASFAFAMTLLVIFFNELPDTVAELRDALWRVPTFALSFVLLSTFWLGHNRWSRRFGLEDATTTVLSLAFVLVVLVFVYPLRMVLSAFLNTISGGALPSELGIDPGNVVGDMMTAFIVYGFGVGLLSLVLWLLNRHSLRHADDLALEPRERHLLAAERDMHGIQAGIAVASILTCVLMWTWQPRTPVLLSLPMWLYALNSVLLPWHWKRAERGMPVGDVVVESAAEPVAEDVAEDEDNVPAQPSVTEEK